MLPDDAIRRTLLRVLAKGATRIARTSPTAKAFASDAASITPRVIARHALEHVHRIRMFRALDASAQRMLAASHPTAAGKWAHYARSEAVHDRYFLRDLAGMGVNRTAIDGTGPFAATRRLGAFMKEAQQTYGAVPIVLYSFWAEESSDIGSRAIIQRTEHLFGAGAVRGASSHRRLDETQDHAGVILQVLSAILDTDGDLMNAAMVLDTITTFVGEYFAELDAWSRDGAFGTRKSHEGNDDYPAVRM